MKKSLFAFTLLIFCFVGVNFAQEKLRKVVKYFAPKYPPAAKATRANGEVIVAVTIDKNGKVISAKSESGHPLLRAISEVTAKDWIFAATDLSEQTLKITFVYSVKTNNNVKNNYNDYTYKIKFKKPYRLEIRATEYPRIDY